MEASELVIENEGDEVADDVSKEKQEEIMGELGGVLVLE